MMAVRANTMVYEAASPPLTQMLLDLLNQGISPVVQSTRVAGRGRPAADGQRRRHDGRRGQVYYQRPAACRPREALALAGLGRLAPFAADDAALTSTNAYSAGQAALLVHDAKRLLDWSDLTFAMSMLGLNSSVTPLAVGAAGGAPVPVPELAGEAAARC